MNVKVYILERHFDYEGFDILSVHEKEESANIAEFEYRCQPDSYFDKLKITEHEVKK